MSGRNAFLILTAIHLYFFTSFPIVVSAILWISLWLSTGGKYWCYLLANTWRRDFRLLGRGLKLLAKIAYIKLTKKNVVQMFRECVNQYPDRIMFVNNSTGEEWTYTQVEEYSNRVANYLLSKGYIKGDTVALFMENRPEYVATWLGMAKIGVIPALINYNLKQQSLTHTIQVADCRAIIYGLELEKEVVCVMEQLNSGKQGFKYFHSKSGADIPKDTTSQMQGSTALDHVLCSSPSEPEPKSVSNSIKYTDNLLYIYTSGTTGLPKAVIIKHMRQLFAMIACHYVIGLRQDDVIYCHLPLYHSSGGQVATCSSLFFGTKTIIRKKFSASSFWKDCVRHNVTATHYIGEICRYLLAAKPGPDDTTHKVRIMFGNGLRPQIWSKFVERFNIPNIAEFYGATEGNSNICNIENKVGAVGFIGVCFPQFLIDKLLPLSLIKVDKDTGEPTRDANGFCQKCAPGEPGEFIGKIVKGDPVKDFHGYRDPEATKKKILTNVFHKGDSFFRSGDILVMDEFGWMYFKDRCGDTFRWRGENVSTAEVEATVSNVLDLNDACSYGVEIEGTEGRAGMVAIPDPDHTMDLVKLYKGIQDKLPSYARPIFVRLVKQLDLTGTYKLKKKTLQAEGFDPTTTSDPIYYMDTRAGQYVPMAKKLYEEIVAGKQRL